MQVPASLEAARSALPVSHKPQPGRCWFERCGVPASHPGWMRTAHAERAVNAPTFPPVMRDAATALARADLLRRLVIDVSDLDASTAGQALTGAEQRRVGLSGR
jgi:hypothetical protein